MLANNYPGCALSATASRGTRCLQSEVARAAVSIAEKRALATPRHKRKASGLGRSCVPPFAARAVGSRGLPFISHRRELLQISVVQPSSEEGLWPRPKLRPPFATHVVRSRGLPTLPSSVVRRR